MNLKSRTLEKKGVRIRLTQMEYAVMKLFMQNPGIALSRESILSSVWGKDGNVEVKIVDVNVRRLRLKLEEDPTNPMFISTVWGVGYKFGS
jgi:DNA-binding response OmpR family regulator